MSRPWNATFGLTYCRVCNGTFTKRRPHHMLCSGECRAIYRKQYEQRYNITIKPVKRKEERNGRPRGFKDHELAVRAGRLSGLSRRRAKRELI